MLRPQTWYLVAAAICAIIAAIANSGTVAMLLLLIAAAVVLLSAIPLFKRRPLQAGVAMLSMVILVAWYVTLAVYNNDLGGGYEFGWTDALPAVAIVLALMARKGIMHDEKVVKAYDRIR